MYRWLRRGVVFGILLVVLLATSSGFALLQESNPYPRDPDAELAIITKLNAWRIRRGLSPLARNSDLDELAMTQARYMAPNVPFTGVVDFHTDQFGENVFRRAEIFGWPGYDYSNRVLISEIAAYFPTVDGIVGFWQNSPIHAASVTNRGFREIGIAVIQHRNWLLAYAVLGGRPNVLPVTYDPAKQLLYLTVDRSVFTDDYRPTRVQMLDRYGRRLHADEWLVWGNTIPLPAGATDVIAVIVSDGIRQISTQVNLDDVRVFPSEPTPIPTSTPTVTPTLSGPLFTATPNQPTATPTMTPLPTNGSFDMRVVYDDRSVTFINQSSHPLDLTPLVIYAPAVNFSRTADWLGQYSEVSLESFPPGYCLQAWSFETYYGPPALPDGCRLLASGRSILTAGQRFWLSSAFQIYYDGNLIASCENRARTCSFDIPGG